MIAGIGLLGDCITLQLEEIVRIVFRFAQGIEVNDMTLALNIIQKVGPGGNFLAERHMLDHLRKEHFIPDLTDRRSYDTWLKDGTKDLVTRAKEIIKEMDKDLIR